MKAKKPIVIICNPVAGRSSSRFTGSVVKALRTGGETVECLYTKHQGDGETIARDLVKENKAKLIVAAGGDGTIREVASGIFESGVTMGIIPSGTANVLARELGYFHWGKRSVARTARILRQGQERPIFPFQVEQNGRIHLGLCWLGVGFDAEVLRLVNPSRKKTMGRFAFPPALLKALSRGKEQAVVSFCNKNGLKDHYSWVLISNISRYAGPFTLTRQTNPFEQGLVCLTFQKSGIGRRLLDIIRIMLALLDNPSYSRDIGAVGVKVGSLDTPAQLDGDFIGFGTVTLKSSAKFITVKTGIEGI